MDKFNIESLVKKVLEESLQEKTDYLVNKIKSKISEEPETAPNPGGCSGSVYLIIGNSPNNTGPIINGTTPRTTCIIACQEECPL
jgi:hypothetical protein